MRRVIICIILVGVMLVIACGCYFYTQSVTENVERRLYDIEAAYERGDNERVRRISDDLGGYWKDFSSCRMLLSDNESVLGITSTLAKMSAMIESGDEGFISECKTAAALVRVYRKEQALRLCNIF